jgi:hypothetical protein
MSNFEVLGLNKVPKKLNLLFMCIALALAGCSGDSGSGDTLTSTTAPTTGGVTPPAAAVSKDYFYVNQKVVQGALRHIHKSNDWNAACFVDLNDTVAANRDISCIFDATELDLMHLGVELEYNVPPFENCSYLTQDSSYFFKFPANESDGTSLIPTTLEYVVDSTTGDIFQDITYKATVNGTLYTGAAALAKVPIINGTPTCLYNYTVTQDDTSAPNCCEGKYALNLGTFDGTATTYASSTGDWGGKTSSCLAGPAFATQDIKDGWPLRTIFRMSTQTNNFVANSKNAKNLNFQSTPKYIRMTQSEIKKLLQEKKFRNSALGRSVNIVGESSIEPVSAFGIKATATTASNFGSWKTGDKLYTLYGSSMWIANWMDSATSSVRAFTDLTNYYGRPDTRPNVWTCYDDAYEHYASISVYIREWNLYSNLLTAYTNKAVQATAEPTAGLAGADDTAGNETDHPSEINNDWLDWEDLRTTLGAHFPGLSL